MLFHFKPGRWMNLFYLECKRKDFKTELWKVFFTFDKLQSISSKFAIMYENYKYDVALNFAVNTYDLLSLPQKRTLLPNFEK